ncbi:MAG TPA: cell division protein ZapA [Clostridiaceae bacterium]|nr:cell division protein ZapA [Clostridiaceae bacterium]
MSERNKVEVKISGKEYVLVGAESEEYIQKVALYIDRKMSEILKANSHLSTSMAAVLTAINVADDLFKVQESEGRLKTQLEKLLGEIEELNAEIKLLTKENKDLSSKNSSLQMELVKREAELKEVRNLLEKYNRIKV